MDDDMTKEKQNIRLVAAYHRMNSEGRDMLERVVEELSAMTCKEINAALQKTTGEGKLRLKDLPGGIPRREAEL
jgi:hypothetical protein